MTAGSRAIPPASLGTTPTRGATGSARGADALGPGCEAGARAPRGPGGRPAPEGRAAAPTRPRRFCRAEPVALGRVPGGCTLGPAWELSPRAERTSVPLSLGFVHSVALLKPPTDTEREARLPGALLAQGCRGAEAAAETGNEGACAPRHDAWEPGRPHGGRRLAASPTWTGTGCPQRDLMRVAAPAH